VLLASCLGSAAEGWWAGLATDLLAAWWLFALLLRQWGQSLSQATSQLGQPCHCSAELSQQGVHAMQGLRNMLQE
jgi:hypothetical protein